MRIMFLANFAPQAVKGLLAGSDREAVLRATFESAGGRLSGMAFTRGAYDVVVSGEVPDQTAGLAIAMAVRATASVSDLVVLEEIDLKKITAAARKVAQTYTPAG